MPNSTQYQVVHGEFQNAEGISDSLRTGTPTHSLDAYLTAFQFVKAEGENPATVLLFWRKVGTDWRVVAYAVETD